MRSRPGLRLLLLPLLALAGLVAGCQKPQPPGQTPAMPQTTNHSRPPTPPGERPLYLNHALPRLRTAKLWIGPKEMEAEVAMTVTEVATGMMYRESMGENDGMLFVFARPHQVGFYMRNTKVPLSAAYIDGEGTIVEIVDLHPLNETPVIASSDRIQYVLETPQGWFRRNNITPGTVLRTERGSLGEHFFGRRGQ